MRWRLGRQGADVGLLEHLVENRGDAALEFGKELLGDEVGQINVGVILQGIAWQDVIVDRHALQFFETVASQKSADGHLTQRVGGDFQAGQFCDSSCNGDCDDGEDFENCPAELDATLDPVLQRAIYKKGRNMFLQLAGEELEYDKNFRLFLQTKLSNPHYKPEIFACCTLINFIATKYQY